MVHINRTYSIEEDLVTKLKEEDNVSELINSLLITYYNKSNSKDLKVLKKKLDNIETEADILRRERDRVADDIRDIEAQTENNEQEKLKELEGQKQKKALTDWLSQKCKEKVITFEEYRNITTFNNWEHHIEEVIKGNLDLKELALRSKPEPEEN